MASKKTLKNLTPNIRNTNKIGISSRIFSFLMKSRLFTFPRILMGKLSAQAIRYRKGMTIYLHDPHSRRIFDFIMQVRREISLVVEDYEAFQLFLVVERTAKIPGDIAEVGVFRGGTAKIICEAKGDRRLYLFDTFEGLPKPRAVDSGFDKEQFTASYESVQEYLKIYSNVHLYKGVFPATARVVEDCKFSFVHLDVDLYESTADCLRFFYPRLTRGGVLLSHDYKNSPGVQRAIDEFFIDKPEFILELPGTQVLIVKV